MSTANTSNSTFVPYSGTDEMTIHPPVVHGREPEDYPRLWDDNFHMSRLNEKACEAKKDAIKYRGSWVNMRENYDRVIKNNELARRLIEESGWGGLVLVDFAKSSKRLVSCMFERWWDTTHTFHFPKMEIGLTPLDFTFLTGISVGRGLPLPFDHTKKKWTWEYVHTKYFSSLPRDVTGYGINGGGISCSTLNNWLDIYSKLQPEVITDETRQQIWRVFVLWMIGQVFFPSNSSVIKIGWLPLVDRVESLEKYDWGSAILSRLYIGLDGASRGASSFDGMWMIVEYWYYACFHSCGPLLESCGDVWPMLQLWNKKNRIAKHDAELYNRRESRTQLEMRTVANTVWQPYIASTHYVRQDVQTAIERSKTRFILFDPEKRMGVWFLGDRCWRQLDSSCFAIPADPPARDSVRGVKEEVYTHFRDVIQFPGAQQFLTQVDEERYNRYWARVGRGPLEPLFYRDGTLDIIGGTAVPHMVSHLQQPPSQVVVEPIVYMSYTASQAAPSRRFSSTTLYGLGGRPIETELLPYEESDMEYIHGEMSQLRTNEELQAFNMEMMKSWVRLQKTHQMHERRLAQEVAQMMRSLTLDGASSSTQHTRTESGDEDYTQPPDLTQTQVNDTYPSDCYRPEMPQPRYACPSDDAQRDSIVDDMMFDDDGLYGYGRILRNP